MPFELGLLVGWHKTKRTDHTWFVLESTKYRLHKSLSDLDGTDPLIHDGTARGVFRVLGDALKKPKFQPTVQHMDRIYRDISADSPLLMRSAGTRSLFAPRVFRQLVVLATHYAERTIPRK